MNTKNLIYKCVENDAFWSLMNRRATREYNYQKKQLKGESDRVVKELEKTGMAISHVKYFPGMIDKFEKVRAISENIENNLRKGAIGKNREYTFSNNILGAFPKFNPNSFFIEFAAQKEILAIVNHYFGFFSQLRKCAVFRNKASSSTTVNANWHRDGICDRPIFRLFVYFNDVTEKKGPFVYVPYTHCKSKEGSKTVIPAHILESSSIHCTGEAGTLIFADTRGYHHGGGVQSGERWLFNAMYTSPSFGLDYFSRQGVIKPIKGDPVSWVKSNPLNFFEGIF